MDDKIKVEVNMDDYTEELQAKADFLEEERDRLEYENWRLQSQVRRLEAKEIAMTELLKKHYEPRHCIWKDLSRI